MAYDEQADAQQSAPAGYYAGKEPNTASIPKDPRFSNLYGGPVRATAQDAIRNRTSEYRLAINQLEALSRALPNELPLPADEILRELVLGY